MRSEGRGPKKKTAPARGRAEAVGVHCAEGARNGTLGLYGAQRTDRVVAACDSAFPFERQGRLLRSRSISGLCSRSLLFRLTTSLSTLRNGPYRTPRKTRYAAAR